MIRWRIDAAAPRLSSQPPTASVRHSIIYSTVVNSSYVDRTRRLNDGRNRPSITRQLTKSSPVAGELRSADAHLSSIQEEADPLAAFEDAAVAIGFRPAIEGTPDHICSLRAYQVLTPSRHVRLGISAPQTELLRHFASHNFLF
jgi:hypothetical protein